MFVLSLGVTLVGLGVVFYRTREQTSFAFPHVLWIFRLTQAIFIINVASPKAMASISFGLSKLDVHKALFDECSATQAPAGILFMILTFTGLSGASGSLDNLLITLPYLDAENPAGFLVACLLFTLVFALPLACVVGGIFAHIKRVNPAFGLARGLSVAALAVRAAVTWLWLFMLPLLFQCGRMLVCRGGRLALVPLLRCDGEAKHVLSVVIALVVLTATMAAVVVTGKKIRALSLAAEAPVERYIRYAFIFGHCKPGAYIHAWMLDPLISLVIVFQTCVLGSLTPGSGLAWPFAVFLPAGLLIAAGVIVYRRSVFASKIYNVSFASGMAALSLAFVVQQAERCLVGLPDFAAWILLVAMLLALVMSVGTAVVAAVQSRKWEGRIVYHADYGKNLLPEGEEGGSFDRAPQASSMSPGIIGEEMSLINEE